MAIVVPFKGVLYNPKKIDDFSKVTAPPYDNISPEQQEKYYKNSPHNVIRLILGKQSPDDSNSDNRYTRGADFFKCLAHVLNRFIRGLLGARMRRNDLSVSGLQRAQGQAADSGFRVGTGHDIGNYPDRFGKLADAQGFVFSRPEPLEY